MTGEVRAGTAVIAAVVAAVIGWQALGPGPERHGGLTRVEAERAMARLECHPPASVRCRATASAWHCVARGSDGATSERDVSDGGTPSAIAFFTCS